MKHISIRTHGFTLIEIMIVVAIIGLLAAMAIPNLLEAQKKARRTACWNNLKQIEGAKLRWSLEHNKGAGMALASFVRSGACSRFGEGIYLKKALEIPAHE
jgi:prepilin-type N-terminal cleavage/methylation domain-containing protein